MAFDIVKFLGRANFRKGNALDVVDTSAKLVEGSGSFFTYRLTNENWVTMAEPSVRNFFAMKCDLPVKVKWGQMTTPTTVYDFVIMRGQYSTVSIQALSTAVSSANVQVYTAGEA